MNIFEVFDLSMPDGHMAEVFKNVEVERIVASKKSGNVDVLLNSAHIISFSDIKKMETAVYTAVFKKMSKKMSFKVRYSLSDQYTPENLWEMVKDDIVLEISETKKLSSIFLSSCTVSFDRTEDSSIVMNLDAPDNFIYRDESSFLKDFLEKTYKERYGFDITVSFKYVPIINKKKNEEKSFIQNVEASQEKAAISLNSGNKEIDLSSKKDDSESKKEEAVIIKKEEKKAEKAEKTEKKFDKNTKFVKKKLFEDPDIIYGRAFEDPSSPADKTDIADIFDEIGEVIVQGKIMNIEVKDTKKGDRKIVIIDLTDFTDSITAKFFPFNEEFLNIKDYLKEGSCIRLKGQALYDSYKKEVGIASIVGIKKISDFKKKRKDDYEGEKRIELHAHTMFSEMDALIDPAVLVKTAFEFGHPGVAITDHGVVQAFPVANHALDPKKFKDDPVKMEKYKNFKIIYGIECYLVDDQNEIVTNDNGQSLYDDAVVFDIETTGFDKVNDKIIEIGAVKVKNGEIIDRFSSFINPQIPIPLRIEELTNISDEMVINADTIDVVLPKFIDFCEGCIVVAHNAGFDTGFTKIKAKELGLSFDKTIVDTVGLTRILLPDIKNTKLDTVSEMLSISLNGHHRAVNDAEATAHIYLKFLEMLSKKGVEKLSEIKDVSVISAEQIKKMHAYHCILLCKNDVGRVNLYKMISMSHLEYFNRYPRIPKSVIMENREGIIIGSACEAGELYQAILNNAPVDEINRLCEFYDYYEIQPLGNNRFMIASDRYPNINSEDDLININKHIIELGRKYNKLVVGTCDSHFLNPEDEVYRRIMLYAKWEDDEPQAPLYFRTTQEMLDEFTYLPEDLAKDIVINNPRKIYDMCEKISPVRPDKCPPVIENSDETLKKICYNTAHKMYGPDLPKPVEERLEHELNSIIKNGYSVMYIIAQKLVWKSNEDGYLVGSRGSVGSSFAATMSGITEVNPLRPHYYCPNCYYSDFDSDTVISAQKDGICGFDMPDRLCPNCGKPLKKDGHDIPFETFLGFEGDKEPDIDLNFSDEYQTKAHDYTEVIFGKGQTFKAGTIGTLAEKTAYGYVLKYDENHNMKHRDAEVKRLASGMIGVRRTTGQHPGGMVVLPLGEKIYSFTPVQRPANDMKSTITTTHFEYHSIDHNLLKLDILGHQDPTMIRRLSDLTGVDPLTIPMDDPKVISLLHSREALGIKNDNLSGDYLGSLGLPELGTGFVMQMLRETKPRNFSDMVRIAGLSHGTDVWNNNAQELINNNTCTLSQCICTRDDIMAYLINKGVNNGHAFKIMESVRKGRGLSPEQEAEMREHDVPDWYIWSCKRIQYMFPKAHATAYMMMALRVAHFKIYYPLAYYAAYFGIRAGAFDYERMCFGQDKVRAYINELSGQVGGGGDSSDDSSDDTETSGGSGGSSAKLKETLTVLRIVEEMYARGYEFKPIELTKAKAHAFIIVDDKIMPSLDSIEGLGEKAADLIEEAVKNGSFISKDDFKTRTKVSQTVVDKLGDLGILGNIPESNQFSIMDLFNL